MFQSQRGHQVQDGVVVPGHGIGVHPNAKPRDWLGPGDERRHGVDILDEDKRGLAGDHKRIQGRVQDFAADVVEHGMRRMDVHPIGVQVDQHLCSFGALLGMQQVLQIGGLLDGGRTRGMETTQPRLGQSFNHAGGVQGANVGRRRQNGALVQVLQHVNEGGDVVRGVHGRGGRGQDWDGCGWEDFPFRKTAHSWSKAPPGCICPSGRSMACQGPPTPRRRSSVLWW